MKKVYYEIHEFEGELLKNIYHYAHNDVLDNKTKAELFYCIKLKRAQISNPGINYKMIFAVMEDYHTSRHILNETGSQAHHLESMILSGLTGKQIVIPDWPLREARLLKEYT